MALKRRNIISGRHCKEGCWAGHRMPPAGLPIEQVLGEYSLSWPSQRRSFIRFHQSLGWLLRSEAHVSPIYFLTTPNIKRQPYHTKPIQIYLNSDNCRPFEAVSQHFFFFFFFSAHFHFPASGQAVDTGVVPSPPRFLP